MMAIVDDLDFIPQHEPGRDTVLVILNHIAETLKKYQSPEGLWYQVMDKSGEPGNYLESSCSAMFVYSLFKAVRKGYIPSSYFAVARKGYEGILNEFIKVDDNGLVSITKACAVAGLGGKITEWAIMIIISMNRFGIMTQRLWVRLFWQVWSGKDCQRRNAGLRNLGNWLLPRMERVIIRQ